MALQVDLLVKGIVHPYRKIVIIYSPWTYLQGFPNLYKTCFLFIFLHFLFSTKDILKNVHNQTVDGRLGKNTVEVNGYHHLFGYQY